MKPGTEIFPAFGITSSRRGEFILVRRTETRALVEGALLAGVAVILVVAGTFLPVVSPLITLLWPVPVMVVQYRYGWRMGLMTLVVAGILVGTFFGIFHGLMVSVAMGGVGLLLGYGFRRGLSPTTVVLLASAGTLAGLLVSLLILNVLWGENLLDLMVTSWREAFETSSQLMQRFGSGEEIKANLKSMAEQFETMVHVIFPSAIILASVGQALINFSLGREILSRLGHRTPPLPPFSRWQLPIYTLYGFLFGAALSYLSSTQGFEPGKLVGQNLLSLFSMLFMIQGMSLAYFFLLRGGLSKPLSVVLIVLLLLSPVLSQIAVLAGMLETALNLRSRVEMGRT